MSIAAYAARTPRCDSAGLGLGITHRDGRQGTLMEKAPRDARRATPDAYGPSAALFSESIDEAAGANHLEESRTGIGCVALYS